MKRLSSVEMKIIKGFEVEDFDINLKNRFADKDLYIFPGFCDVHVHFREPGFSYKETIKSGSMAAARGGFTTVCTMPNLDPVPDDLENLKKQLDIIEKDAVINVVPYGSITKKEQGRELSSLEEMAAHVVAFSDDGRGIQDETIMIEAMKKVRSLGKVLVAHCEDNSLIKGGYIHDGIYAREHGHKGICSESEWGQIKRDVALAAKTDCPYHVCHISTKESVQIIREAKKSGINVSCETAPHYLVLDENDLQEDGRFKMNPPLRSREDREALLEGIADGTIDMIATDHAPHSYEEKNKGLKDSSFGIVGIETAFPLLYTHLVRNKIVSIHKLLELLISNPRKRFGLAEDKGYTVWDLKSRYIIDPSTFISKGRSTPFEGREVFGECVCTMINGKYVFKA